MANADWDLGQKLIERGICSLDQIREVISLQDRMRKMGAAPKPFPRVLLERGFATRDQLLRAGVPEEALPPPVEEKPVRPSAARRYAERRSSRGPVVALLVLAAVGGLAYFGYTRLAEPPPPPAPAPPPAVSDVEADQLLQEELSRIGALQNLSPDFENAAEVVKRYEAFVKGTAGRKWEIEGHRRLKEYRDRVDAFAKPELEAIRKREAELAGEGRWAELLALYRKFPAKYLAASESGRAVKEKISELSQKVREIYLRDKADAEKLLQSGQFSDALARAQSMELSAASEQLSEIADLKTRIERESRGAAARTRQDISDRYFRIDGDFKGAMVRRDPRRAALVVGDFIYAPWKEDQRPFARVKDLDYQALKKALEEWKPDEVAVLCDRAIPEVDSPEKLSTGETALLSLRNAALLAIFLRDQMAQFKAVSASGATIDLPSLGRGRFEKRGEQTVFVREEGDVLDPARDPLRERDLAWLAMKAGPADAAMHARVGFFYFYSAPDMPERAFEHLTKAHQLGARGVKVFLGGLAVTAQAELARRLRTKFGAAQEFFKKRQWPQTQKLLGEVLEYADHPFTSAIRSEIEKMLFEIAEGTDKEKRLAVQYKGRVEAVDSATLRVLYDFEGKEQVDAFEMVAEEGGRKFKGKWRIERGAMESAMDASVMRWKAPVKGDVRIEYDLTPLEEPQNIVLNLYTHRGQSRHYAFVTGFDWVSKPEGDPGNTVEDRFGMPRTCVIKYPVAVDKSRWVLEGEWENWKMQLAGKPFGDWKPAKGKTARLAVDRQGKSIRVHADRVLVWEGEDDAYSEGQLLFFSDCRCRIDNLAITFKPAE